MIKEEQTLNVSMFINLALAIIKIVCGIFFNSYILMMLGYYTLCNYINEAIAYIGSVVRMRKANMRHPFGFGKQESILHIFVGIILIITSIYLFEQTFYLKFTYASGNIIFIMITIILMHFLNSNYTFNISKNIFSQSLYITSKNSYYDALLNILMFILIMLSIKIPLINLYGCLFVSVLIFIKGYKIITSNIILVHSSNDTSKRINDKVKQIINKYNNVYFNSINLNNINKHYTATIEISIDDDLSLPELIKIEREIKYNIYRAKLKIKHIDFEIVKD